MAPKNNEVVVSAAAAALGRLGGVARAKALSKKQRVAIARKASKASIGKGGGWPKGKKRGPRKAVAK